MSDALINIALVLVFIVVGGVFAAAEIALVSLREGQLKALSQRGRRGARVAELAEDPNRFLSAVQIGVTLMGFLSAAFGGATLAEDLAPLLVDWGVPTGWAPWVALVLITLVISYASILLGELVPKRLALQRAEAAALLIAPMVDRIATFASPVIWLLGKNANVLVAVLGGDPGAQREQISEEELRDLVTGHESLGEEERRIVEDVFDAGDRQVREVMLPRTEVDFLDASMPVFKAVRLAADKPHSRYPVVRGSADEVVGFVHVRDLFDPDVGARSMRVGELARDVVTLPGTKRVLPALTELRRRGSHLAIVADEYGGTAGIVTLEDLVEELVGDIRDEYDVDEPAVGAGAPGGPVEVEGLLNLEDFADATGVELPEGPYETVAGFLVAQLGRVPRLGDAVDVPVTVGSESPGDEADGADGAGGVEGGAGRHRLSVLELDGRRIARVLVEPLPRVRPAPDGTGDIPAAGDAGPRRADPAEVPTVTISGSAPRPGGATRLAE